MSDRDAFLAGRRARWDRLEQLLLRTRTASEWSEVGALYRTTCADLAHARSKGLPKDIQDYLDELAGRAHNHLYGARQVQGLDLARLVGAEFPRELRRQWRFFLASNLLFYGPFLLMMALCLIEPSMGTLVVSEGQLAETEMMYSSPDMIRSADQDATMAGFYVWNNVGIAFRCFATGVLFGLGSVYYLVQNGLAIGTVAGYLGAVGYGGNLGAFVAGHGPWELTGVVVAGAAGLQMGWALVATGGRTRVGSLTSVAPSLYRLVVGATVMLLIAALIEGFWSAGPVPPVGKLIFGLLQIGVVAAWLLIGGRRRG